MASMLICFRNNTDPKPLEDFVCGNPVWKDEVQDVFILNEDQERILVSAVDSGKQYLAIPGRGSIKRVLQREIRYLEKAGRCILIHMDDGRTLTFYGKFDDIMSMLSHAFFWCHKSFIVNLDKVEELQRYSFLMKDGERLPISQKKYQRTREFFQGYLSTQNYLEKDRFFIEK